MSDDSRPTARARPRGTCGSIRRRALELDVSTLEAAQTFRRPANHVDQDAALHTGERPPHPVWHLVLGVDLDQDVPDVRRQVSLSILLLEGLDDLYALLDQLTGDGRDRHVVRQVEHPQTTRRLPDATDLYLVALDGDGLELKQAVAVCRRTQRDLPLDVPLTDAECRDRLTWCSGAEQTVEDVFTTIRTTLTRQLNFHCRPIRSKGDL